MEAALAGVPAVSMSQTYARGETAPADLWAASTAHGAETLRRVLAMPMPAGTFYNVNFPAREAAAVAGLRVCPQGMRAKATFDLDPYEAANGRLYHFLRHTTANASAEAGSDASLVAEGWITVTPLGTRLTDTALLEEAAARLDAERAAE
jgi:5'-nucleotidase